MSDGDEITCQQVVKIINDYLDGALSESERERFEAHLQDCEGCRRYLHQMRTTVRIAGTLTEESIDPAAKDELLHLFRDWNRA
jgi:anti-sigma factor RsiW